MMYIFRKYATQRYEAPIPIKDMASLKRLRPQFPKREVLLIGEYASSGIVLPDGLFRKFMQEWDFFEKISNKKNF